MINRTVETEGSNSNYAESESVPETEGSVFSQQENRVRLESIKKLKKVRSIRLHRLSSMRSSIRRGKPQNENLSILSSIGTESSEWPTQIDVLDASPHYMKGTSSSHAKESFQNTQRVLSKKTLTRMSTVKLKRSLTRKLSGRTDLKRKLKSSRSIKLGSFKGPKSTKKVSESESIYGTDEQNWKSTSNGNKPQRVLTRRLSLKPVRILTKMPTFKSKKSSMDKGHHVSQSLESSLHRATCSSTLKDSHFPDHIELPQEGSGSEGVSAMKVCPYTYCSLHGHRRRDDLPPLKRFVSMRRRMLKSQKSMRIDGRPVAKSKQSGNARKTTQKTRNVHSESGISHFQNVKKLAKGSSIRPHESEGSTLVEGGTSMGEDEEKCNFRYDTEVLRGETPYPQMINHEESTSIDEVKSSASDIEILEGEVTTKGKNREGDNEVMKMSSVQQEAKPAYRVQERDDKYMKMWHLVYKHAVLGNTGREERNDKEGEGKEAQSFNRVNSPSSQDHCETNQDVDDENKSVIELVQKAFDEILLPEPEDLTSDDDFKSRGIRSDEELSEKSEDKRGEGIISTSRESPTEETRPNEDHLRSSAEEMTGHRMGSKPEPKTPKSWSNLKKLILLRRFVKALEKVRKLNFRRPRHLPSDANFEPEKVFLKHQTAEEKRSAEEWMLDYALQKVISKLAPAQRQRVSLLVEAFETILPYQDIQNASLSSATTETEANPIQSLDDSSDHSKEETDKDNAIAYSMPEMHNPVVLKESCLDYPGTKTVENFPAPGAVEEETDAKRYDNEKKALTGNDNICLAEIEDPRSRSLSKPVENISSRHEEAPSDKIVDEVPEDLISNSDTGNPTSQSESPGRDFETINQIGANREQFSMSKSVILKGLVRSLGSNMVGSGESSDLLDEPITDRKDWIGKANLETGTLKGIPTREQSKAPVSPNVEPETQPEKQNYMGLWYLVYKHMVSDSAENDSMSPIDGADQKKSEYEGGRTGGTSVSYESTHVKNKDQVESDPEVELQRIEAIKMVEEAIDSIIPDDQDHTPDIQLLTDNRVSDNSSQQSNRTERVYSGINQKEERMESGNGITTNEQEEEKETESKEGNNPNQQLSRSWSNLKKVILLRRFIKALEKVRKFNPRGPRYLPIEPDSESEKVNLRHQDMSERKGTEEWMLDYALRQVVSQLTPARKRKVGLLVEAFETVMPTMKN